MEELSSSRKLQSGDIVEVLTSKNQKPSKDWLSFVATSKARNKIRSFLRDEQRTTSRKIGKDLLAHELGKLKMSLDRMVADKRIDQVLSVTKEKNIDDLYLSIGYGKINPKELIEKAYPKAEAKPDAVKTHEPRSIEEKLLNIKKLWSSCVRDFKYSSNLQQML